jgi:hypothetical protein
MRLTRLRRRPGIRSPARGGCTGVVFTASRALSMIDALFSVFASACPWT